MHAITKSLLEWYDQHKRSLPWRLEPPSPRPGDECNSSQNSRRSSLPNPYHVWLSEIMLQQTTVATVKGYFTRFLAKWPTLDALANAPLEDILAEWAGLGYYARARNLHKCAVQVVTSHAGRFPPDEKTLLTLPGIGPYTAAAISAIAFDRPAAVVDGNVERVVTRLFRLGDPLPGVRPKIRDHTKKISPKTPAERPGDFAQATMDLGATICSPKNPLCHLCPLSGICAAFKAGDMLTYPVKAPKKQKPTRYATAFLLKCGDYILLERRPEKGLLASMPGLLTSDWKDTPAPPYEHRVFHQFLTRLITTDRLPKHTNDPKLWTHSGTSKHTFTHFHLITQIYIATVPEKHNPVLGFWHPASELDFLPTVFLKMAHAGLNSQD